ncbi:hypothetical protein [Pyruvatibacter sp.]
MDTLDIRITALDYTLNFVVSELNSIHPNWNERVEEMCELASLDYTSRMRQSGAYLEPETEAFMAMIMCNYQKADFKSQSSEEGFDHKS